MIFDNHQELVERIEHLSGRTVYGRVKIFEDASSYMSIHGGTVLRLADNDYFVLGDTREGRFGIDEQPKFWVKYALDLTTGERKIIKLVFQEQFTTNLANIQIRCLRNPHKESALLELVRGHPHFMQGHTVADAVGNPIRIIDFIRGRSLYRMLMDMEMPHEQYFHEVLPGLMQRFIPLIQAMALVHRQGHHHGDIRSDHVMIDHQTGAYAWIDFDYEVNFADYDVWSMGNIIVFAVGKGSHTFQKVLRHPESYPQMRGALDEHDAMILLRHRVANLAKLFPYIPPQLNRILMRFSAGAIDFFENLESQVNDLWEVFPPPL